MNNLKQWFKTVEFVSEDRSSKTHCPAGWDWHREVRFHFLWFVTKGKGTIKINDKTYPLLKNSCCLFFPGDKISTVQDETDRMAMFFIRFSILDANSNVLIDSSDQQNILPRCSRIEDSTHMESLLNRALDIDQFNEPYREEEFDLIMKMVFTHLYRICENGHGIGEAGTQMHKQLVRKVISTIRLNLSHQEPIDYMKLADSVGLSRRYLSRLFKKYTGLSLKEYITRLRMERALYLLTEYPFNITRISELVGYSDIYYFSKVFKQHFGWPPSECRHKGIISALNYKNTPTTHIIDHKNK
jgi:AraC-like DNA-binding protein